MKRLSLICALSIFTAQAQEELDPPSTKAVVLKVNQKTNQVEAFSVDPSVFKNGKLSESEAKKIIQTGKGLTKISQFAKVNTKSEEELDRDRSVGNWYYYGYRYRNNWRWNRGHFHYNRFRYNYRFSYNRGWNNWGRNNWGWNYRYHWYY